MNLIKFKNYFVVFVLSFMLLCTNCIHETDIPAKKLTLKAFKILAEDATQGSVTIRTREILLEKSDIVIEFEEDDFDGDFICSENFPIKLTENTKKEITITTIASKKYLVFQKTVTINCSKQNILNLKKLTIFGQIASSKFYIPKNKNKIEKTDIELEFIQNDAPTTFDILPNPFKIKDEENNKKLIIFIDDSPLYEKWQIEIDVLREKPNIVNRTIDDAILKLESLVYWVNTTVEKDIALLNTIEGFENSIVEWSSSDIFHCTNDGKITQDLKDISITFAATVKWNNREKTVYFNVVIGRIKKIVKIEPTKPFTTEIIYDFSSPQYLNLYQSGVLMKKYQIKSIDIEKKKLTSKLISMMNGDGEIVNVEELKDSPQKYEIVRVLFGEKFKKLKNATQITWEEFKDYANDYLNIVGLGSFEDEELFDLLVRGAFFPGIPLMFFGTFEEFKKLDPIEITRLLQDLLKKAKDDLIRFEGWNKNLSDDELLPSLLEEFKTKFDYKIYFLSKDKKHSYILEKTKDSEMWNSGYSFETKAIYQKDIPWQEQNGFYVLKDIPSNVRLYIEVIYKNKEGAYHGTVTYDESNITKPSPRYQFSGLLLDEGFSLLDEGYNKILEGNIKDLKNGKISMYISTHGISSGTNILTFVGDSIR